MEGAHGRRPKTTDRLSEILAAMRLTNLPRTWFTLIHVPGADNMLFSIASLGLVTTRRDIAIRLPNFS